MPNLKHFSQEFEIYFQASAGNPVHFYCRALDAQPCEERDTLDRGFGVQLLEKLTIGEISYWRNLLEKSGLLGCGLLSREVLPMSLGTCGFIC